MQSLAELLQALVALFDLVLVPVAVHYAAAVVAEVVEPAVTAFAALLQPLEFVHQLFVGQSTEFVLAAFVIVVQVEQDLVLQWLAVVQEFELVVVGQESELVAVGRGFAQVEIELQVEQLV